MLRQNIRIQIFNFHNNTLRYKILFVRAGTTKCLFVVHILLMLFSGGPGGLWMNYMQGKLNTILIKKDAWLLLYLLRHAIKHLNHTTWKQLSLYYALLYIEGNYFRFCHTNKVKMFAFPVHNELLKKKNLDSEEIYVCLKSDWKT